MPEDFQDRERVMMMKSRFQMNWAWWQTAGELEGQLIENRNLFGKDGRMMMMVNAGEFL